MIKKILILVLFTCFVFAEEEAPLSTTSSVVVDKKDKAEVKQIEQKIIKEKYEESKNYKTLKQKN